MTFTLKAQIREVLGKKNKENKDSGEMPVVVYGAKTDSLSLMVDQKDFEKIFKQAGESSVIELDIPEGKKDVLIHEVQFHHLSGRPIHADLLVVDKNKKIEVPVPLVFEGVAPAVKDLGGNLVKVLHEIEIEALPRDLPHDIKVDISVLKTLDSQILVKDLVLPAGVALITDAEDVVASITEAGEEVKEEEAPVDLSAIEVEKKGKVEGEEEVKEAE